MPARILYVDDEDDIREIAQMSLELDPQFEVRSCASGVEALTDAADWQPDLILLDAGNPAAPGRFAADGVDTRGIHHRPHPDASGRAHLAMGAVGVIAKPFDPMALAGEVRRLLSSGGGRP